MRIVVLGGYGNFGARICRALHDSAGIELVVAGRDGNKAAALAASLGGTTKSAMLDIAQPDLSKALRKLEAGLVIHTAGPFQNQGYDVPLAVAKAGAHYIDLADGRRFVCDFSEAVQQAFLAQKRVAITGASTVPALSSAVVNHLSAGWQQLDEIEYCIAPAQTAPRGVATMAAVLNYCGAPVQVWKGNQWVERYGWSDPALVKFKRLKSRLGALCDIPDLELFPRHYPGVKSVMFRAALEIGIAQRALATIAAGRKTGLIREPQRFARLFNQAAQYLDPFGSALGGMVVRATGISQQGLASKAEWHIAADNDHGPEIPCMAAILLARRLAGGETMEPGAHACIGMLRLQEFEPEFAKWGMITDIVN